MKKARVVVTIRKDVLDPAGVAVKNALHRAGLSGIGEVRIGKVIDLELNDHILSVDRERIDEIAKTILSNPIMEDVSIHMLDEMRHDQ